MTGLDILDIAIGLTFTYLLLSLLCSVINEWIASAWGSRGKHLMKALDQLIGPAQCRELMKHPLIGGLRQHGVRALSSDPKQPPVTPSYIPARTFALAVLDLISKPSASDASLAAVKAAALAATSSPSSSSSSSSSSSPSVSSSSDSSGNSNPLAQAILTLADKGSGDLAELRQNIENWYNDAMDRLSGWYKRRTQVVLVVISAVVTVSMNVDSVTITKALYANPALRSSIVQDAQTYLEKHPKEQQKKSGDSGQPTTFPSESFQNLNNAIGKLNLPIGWGGNTGKDLEGLAWAGWLFGKMLGWFVTAAAISLGAPFWFDTLNRFMQFRSSVKPPDKPKP